MIYVLLVIAAWGSLLVPAPRWVDVVLSVGFMGLGAVLLLFGLVGVYWDSHMTGAASSATSTLWTGILLLLSRAALVARVVLHALVSPPG